MSLTRLFAWRIAPFCMLAAQIQMFVGAAAIARRERRWPRGWQLVVAARAYPEVIVAGIVATCNALRLGIIVEGVETAAEYAYLRSVGNHAVSGHSLRATRVPRAPRDFARRPRAARGRPTSRVEISHVEVALVRDHRSRAEPTALRIAATGSSNKIHGTTRTN